MKTLIQRVSRAQVSSGGQLLGRIGHGLLMFVCAEPGDTPATGEKLLLKALKLRIFSDPAGKMNRSLQDVGGGLLIVSQFTLAADTRSGNRPSFAAAAAPELGCQLYEDLIARAHALHPEVASGRFGADMQVELINDGPVTLWLQVPPPPAA